MDLFPDFEQPEIKKVKGETCGTCKHRQRWKCGSKVIQYCGKNKCNRTYNGLRKIKCKTEACGLWEEG